MFSCNVRPLVAWICGFARPWTLTVGRRRSMRPWQVPKKKRGVREREPLSVTQTSRASARLLWLVCAEEEREVVVVLLSSEEMYGASSTCCRPEVRRCFTTRTPCAEILWPCRQSKFESFSCRCSERRSASNPLLHCFGFSLPYVPSTCTQYSR